MRSMTGFGVGEAPLADGALSLEARSVNHRYLDVRVRMPRDLAEHGLYVEQLARAKVSRGRLEISVHHTASAGGALVLDKARAQAVLKGLREVAQELGIHEPVPLSVLGSVPDLFVPTGERDPEAVRGALSTTLERALVALDEMRKVEGRNLGADLRARLGDVASHVARIGQRAPEVVVHCRVRFRERIERLLDGSGQRLEVSRFEQEVALLADHMDVAEELTRLGSHCGQFSKLLEADEPVGRRMDFLLQEMSREVNTVGAKSADAEIALRVVELKAELERMREQVQNVE